MPRGYNKSPAAYQDCEQVMNKALDNPGMIVTFPTVGAAINFRQRCYRYRNIVRALNEEVTALVPGRAAVTAYDVLVIRHHNLEPGKRTSRWLRFDRYEIGDFKVTDKDGNEIDVVPKTVDDDLFD